jgi:hypothetical protein
MEKTRTLQDSATYLAWFQLPADQFHVLITDEGSKDCLYLHVASLLHLQRYVL